MLSKRQRPKIDEYPEYLFGVLHFPVYDKVVQRLNAGELDVFLGPDYLVTLPAVELLPVTRLFRRCDDDAELRESLFGKGSGYLLYHVLDDLFDYCFPILDKIGHKLDTVEDEMFEGRSEEVVRDISNVKQEIISYRKIIKPERATLRMLERQTQRFLPEELEVYFDDIVDASERIWDLLDNYKEVVEGARVDERVGDLAPPERHPADADRVQRRAPAADGDQRHLRDERRLPRLRHARGVVGRRRDHDRRRRRSARVLPVPEVLLAVSGWPIPGSSPASNGASTVGATDLSRDRSSAFTLNRVEGHDLLDELFDLRRRIEAGAAAGIPLSSPKLAELVDRHDDLLARLTEQTIVPVAWEDDWSPATLTCRPEPKVPSPGVDARRARVLVASVALVALVLFLFVAAPEWIGDRPYNVF